MIYRLFLKINFFSSLIKQKMYTVFQTKLIGSKTVTLRVAHTRLVNYIKYCSGRNLEGSNSYQ